MPQPHFTLNPPMRLYAINFLMLFSIVLSAQEPQNNRSLSTEELQELAIQETYLLESAINAVIAAGKRGEDADELIETTIMPHIRFGATMQTCSMNKTTGQCEPNKPIDYKAYFTGLWRRAMRCNNMQVKFVSVKVVENQPYRGRAKVEFKQEYRCCGYEDETDKIMVVYLEMDSDNNLKLKIGNTRVK